MRNFILTLPLVTIMAGPAVADPHDENCAVVAVVAESTMKARQTGVSLGQMLKILSDNGDIELFRTITLAAYDRPRMSVSKNQERMISDFRDEWHLLCLQAGG